MQHVHFCHQVANLLGEEIPQIWAICGRGSRSSLRVLRPGLAVTEMAVSPLPGAPQAVFTVRRARTDEYDAYIVVSFTNATLVRPMPFAKHIGSSIILLEVYLRCWGSDRSGSDD